MLTADLGLVILSISETDGGQWQLRYEEKEKDMSLTLCTYNVTVEVQKCSAPSKSSDFQKVYSEWCHEFQKYKQAMQAWQRRQEVSHKP